MSPAPARRRTRCWHCNELTRCKDYYGGLYECTACGVSWVCPKRDACKLMSFRGVMIITGGLAPVDHTIQHIPCP